SCCFSRMRRKVRIIHLSGTLGMNGGIGDHRIAPTTANHTLGPWLTVDPVASRLDVVLERGQRVLHDSDAIPESSQLIVYTAPTGAIGERAVNEYHASVDGGLIGSLHVSRSHDA